MMGFTLQHFIDWTQWACIFFCIGYIRRTNHHIARLQKMQAVMTKLCRDLLEAEQKKSAGKIEHLQIVPKDQKPH